MQTVEKTSGRSKKLLPFLLTGTVAAASVVAMGRMDTWEDSGYRPTSATTEQSRENRIAEYRAVVPGNLNVKFKGAQSIPHYQQMVRKNTQVATINQADTYTRLLEKGKPYPKKVTVTGYIFWLKGESQTTIFQFTCTSPVKVLGEYEYYRPIDCKEEITP